MLVVADWGDEPADRRQRPRLDVAHEVIRVQRQKRLLVQGRRRVLVLAEVGKDGVAQDAEFLLGLRRVEGAGRGVDLPAHTGVLEYLGHRVPVHAPDGVGRRVGDEHGSARRTGGVDRARECHEPVGVGGPEHRAVVVVADGEGVGEGVVVGEIGALVVAHGELALRRALELRAGVGGHEGAVGALVPTHVLPGPAVVEVLRALADARLRIEVEREERLVATTRPGLREVPQRASGVVVEAAHPAQRSVVVVERPVLLHQEDDVLNGTEVRSRRPGPRRGLCHRGAGALTAARRRQHRRAPRGERGL